MARLKSRPLQRTTKRKSQDRDRVHRESLRTSSNKRPRLQSPAERQQLVSKKTKKKKAKILQKKPEDAHLPPELRKAGLMAHMAIPKGKCFGPFSGRIMSKGKSPDKMHFLVLQLADKKGKSHFFHARKSERNKCSWLSRLQSAASEEEQNIVAYESSMKVYLEAIKDIAEGEELMVLFDDSFRENGPTMEAVPSVSYITDESGGRIAVVPLDRKVDESKVYVNPVDDNDNDNDDGVDKDDGNDDSSNDGSDSEGDELYKVTEDSCGEQDTEMEDDSNGDDDDEDDDEDDDDFIPNSLPKSTKNTIKRKRSSGNDIEVLEEIIIKKKKKQPKIKELTVIGPECEANAVKYCCAHCLEEFREKEKALEHSAAMECLSKEFQCSTCTLEFTKASLLQKHLCGGKPICKICDEEFDEVTQLQAHEKNPPADHLPRCAKCDVQFPNQKDKCRHVRAKHSSTEKQAECPICHKTYNKSYLKEHVIIHSQSDALKCQECGKTFSSKSNLNKHRKKHAPGYTPKSSKQREKKFICPEEGCEKTFDSQHALKSHQRCHTGERPFQCQQCSWRFTQKTHLTRHIKSVHEKIPRSKQSKGGSNAPVTCDMCNKVYVNSRVLSVHIQSVHDGLRPYKCDYCDATYTQRGHLWRHKHASHFEKEEVQKKYTSDKFCCNFDDCEQVFDAEPELVEHVKTHQGTTDKACMCSECGATFASQQNLWKHTKRRHTGPMASPHKTHRCEKCDKTFLTSYQLVVHFRCHTGEKPYKCDLCGKDFVQKSGLRKHIRCKRCPMIEGGPINNKNSRKYACEQCGKMFPGPSDLKAHQRTHTGEKPYQCHVCEKGFSQPGNLTKHVRFVHNKEQRPKEKIREKKYFCSLCGKAFLCPSSLAMHCRTHSGDKPYSCEQCGQAFAQAGNLKKHVKRWHENGGEGKQRRKKSKGKNGNIESTDAQGQIEPPVDESSTQTQGAGQHEGNTVHTSDANTSVSPAISSSLPAQAIQDTQNTCTPLNTPSPLYAATATPLNTVLPNTSHNATVASQRIPILFGFVAPLETNTVPTSQTPGATSRTPLEQSDHLNPTNAGMAMNVPLTAPQSTNLGSLTAQELQQVVISRMLASENTDNAFVPPNLSGFPAISPPRPQVLLPHVHSLLTPTGGNSAGEVTVWPFSSNSGVFQQ